MSMDENVELTPPKQKNKRTKAQREMDRAFLAELLTHKFSCRDMAEEIARVRPYRLSFQQIAADVQKIRAEWKQRIVVAIDAMQAEYNAQLDQQLHENWLAWIKSKQDSFQKRAEKTELGTVAAKEGTEEAKQLERQKQSVVQETQCGNVQYQRMILDLGQEKAKLFGLYAPQKTQHEVSGPAGEALAVTAQVELRERLEKLTDAELDAMIAGSTDGQRPTTQTGDSSSAGGQSPAQAD